MTDWDFPCKVVFSDSGWAKFGQKGRYKGQDRIGKALGFAKSWSYLSGYIRVKWDSCKTIQYYLPSDLKLFNPPPIQAQDVRFH